MSFLDTHSSGLFKPQSGLNSSDGLKPQDPNISKPQMMAANREKMLQQAPNLGAYASVVLGNKTSSGQPLGKTNQLHTQGSGWVENNEEDGVFAPRTTFLSRQTALPWNSPNHDFLPTLNFLS